jgi:DNA-binding transcriptional MerR regulator
VLPQETRAEDRLLAKSRDAFRTISEVADWLDTPAHVLRFWESKFTQIKPVKRAGGRRYYRPQDMALLSGIKTLLHTQGMTIKGAQKLLREKGVKHVSALGEQPNDTEGLVVDAQPHPVSAPPPPPLAASTQPDPNDPWPADPTPAPEVAQPAPEPVAQASFQQPAQSQQARAARRIPALPDEAAVQLRPGILTIALGAHPAKAAKNRDTILALYQRLETCHYRMMPGG